MDRIILVQEQPRGASQLVEIPVTVAGTRINLPDVQQLRNTATETVVIKAIRLVTFKVLTNGLLQNTLVNAPLTELRKMALVLYAEGWEKGLNIPILTLNDYYDADAAVATTIPFRQIRTAFADWKSVDWSKSYLNFVAPAVPSYVVLLEVEYQKFDVNTGREITYQK